MHRIAPLLLASCAPDDAAPPWRALPLAVERAPRAADPPTRVLGPDDLALHVVRGRDEGTHTIDATPVRRLGGDGPRLVAIPVPSVPDVVRVEAAVPPDEHEPLRVALRWEGEDVAYGQVELLTEPRPATLDLLVTGRVPRDARVDAVMLQFAGESTHVDVASVALVDRPPADLLRATEPHLTVDGDTRIGRVLDAGTRLVVRPEAPGELVLSYSLGSDGELVVSDTRLPLAGEPSWTQVRVPVPTPGPVELRVTPGAHTAVADVGLRTEVAAGPTVVLITSDTHRADHVDLGLGSPPVRTPALRRLAGRGTVFTDATAPSNATNPSHASLLTGLHVRDTRVVDNSSPLVDDAVTLAERFRDAGWRTAAVVSALHLGDSMSGLRQGFERFDAPASGTRDGSRTVRRALRHLDDARGDPLFLWVHVFDAHVPYVLPPEFDRRYYPDARDPRADGPGLPLPRTRTPRSLRGVVDPAFPTAQYRASVDYVDHALAPLLDRAESIDAVVAFTADHGESLGEHGTWWAHDGVYPQTTRVPLVLRVPGGRRTVVDAPARLLDLGRTLLDLAGLRDVPFPGRALGSDAPPEPRFAIGANATSASIDDGRWLLLLYLRDHVSPDRTRTWERGQAELYDRDRDPACETDLVRSEPERAARMRTALLRWLANAAPVGLAGTANLGEEAAAVLADLGYADGDAPDDAWYPDDGDDWWSREMER